MEVIKLPYLRNAELQTLCESSVLICESQTVLQPFVAKVTEVFIPFKAGMLKVRASASDKKNLDKIRDRYVIGFFEDVKAEAYFPHENEASRNVVLELNKVVNKYGGKISRLPLNEETAAIDNLIMEVDKLDLSALETTCLMRWKPLIVDANNNFKAASDEYIEDCVEASNILAASKLAPALSDALVALYSMLFAHIKLTQDPALISTHAKLKELVDSFR